MNGSTEVETRQPETPLKDEIGSNADVKKQVEIHVPSSDNSGTLDAPTSQARALLPRNTLVRIVGNARTNPKLIGLEGQVRRAMGLGKFMGSYPSTDFISFLTSLAEISFYPVFLCMLCFLLFSSLTNLRMKVRDCLHVVLCMCICV